MGHKALTSLGVSWGNKKTSQEMTTSGLGRNWSLPEGEQMGGKQHRQQQKRREGVKEGDLLEVGTRMPAVPC